MTKITTVSFTRRTIMAAAGAATATLAAPRILSAQTKEVVVGGAASHKSFVEQIVAPAVEKKFGCKVVFEGSRSLVNLEKMQKNKDKQYLSVVMMDDPVMIPAVSEGLLEKLTPEKVPNLKLLKAGTIHMDGMWCNYLQPWLGIAYNPKVMPAAPTSWAQIYDPKYKGRIILPSLQNTEGLANLFMAAHLATGKPMAEAQKDIDAAFKKLVTIKPNLLTVYTQMPQAYNLLEQGEGFMISSAISQVALDRKASGAPVDIAVPKEGIFSMPSGVALVKGAPQPELGAGYVDVMLSVEVQSALAAKTNSLPTNKDAAIPPGMPTNATIHTVDWAFVAANRGEWVKRWDREMALYNASWRSRFSMSRRQRSPSALPPYWAASICKWPPASSSRCSDRRGAARPRCSGSWPAFSPPTAARSGSTARTSRASLRTGGTSAWSSRTTRCSPISPLPRTWLSA